MENHTNSCINSMEVELSKLHSLSTDCCIYKVPTRIRCLNDNAYTPQIVSIGPIHHGKETLKDMEAQKWRFLKHFIRQTGVGLRDYFDIVKKRENEIRDCYAEFITFSSDDFVKLVLLDAVFIIEVILGYLDPEFRCEIDRIFGQPRNIVAVNRDMILLENQIPFFIVKDIYERARMNGFVFSSFPEFCIEVLFMKLPKNYSFVEPNFDSEIYTPFRHILDLQRNFYIPLKLEDGGRGQLKCINIPTITELHHAGVKLKIGSEKNLFAIKFEKGILEIPKLLIQGETEIYIRNIIAFEQCHCDIMNFYITSYFILMKGLIKSRQDLELLMKYGIIESTWESTTVTTIFQTQVIGTILSPQNFYFASLCENMDKYCKSSWHQWKANLKQNYFNTPWTIISVIAASIILILTFIQTVCSLLSLKSSK